MRAVREYLPARHRPGHLRQLMLALEKPAAAHRQISRRRSNGWRNSCASAGSWCSISDLLAPAESLETTARAAHRERARGRAFFNSLDPAEMSFDFSAAVALRRSGNRSTIFSSNRRSPAPNTAAAGGASRRGPRDLPAARHQHVQLSTAQPLELALSEFLTARRARAKSSAAKARLDGYKKRAGGTGPFR